MIRLSCWPKLATKDDTSALMPHLGHVMWSLAPVAGQCFVVVCTFFSLHQYLLRRMRLCLWDALLWVLSELCRVMSVCLFWRMMLTFRWFTWTACLYWHSWVILLHWCHTNTMSCDIFCHSGAMLCCSSLYYIDMFSKISNWVCKMCYCFKCFIRTAQQHSYCWCFGGQLLIWELMAKSHCEC